MDSPTTRDALKRVSEAEKRIGQLADQVYNHRLVRQSASPVASRSPYRTAEPQHASLTGGIGGESAEPPQADASIRTIPACASTCVPREEHTRLEMKYEVLEARVRDLEALVSSLQLDLAEVKRTPNNASLCASARPASSLHLEGLHTIPTTRTMSFTLPGSDPASTMSKSGSDFDMQVRLIHQAFDQDRDGFLNFNEAATMQKVTDGEDMEESDFLELCTYLKVADAKKGVSESDLMRMYSDPNIESNIAADLGKARAHVCHQVDALFMPKLNLSKLKPLIPVGDATKAKCLETQSNESSPRLISPTTKALLDSRTRMEKMNFDRVKNPPALAPSKILSPRK
eukprot:Rhum_TRINITY_DN4156_c0_g2::Rhum_TRINITY_DN4156_c0_g2_i1::g.13116::m.13116